MLEKRAWCSKKVGTYGESCSENMFMQHNVLIKLELCAQNEYNNM